MSLEQINGKFLDIVKIIETARENAFKKVNAELVLMYWNIGEYISKAVDETEYGDSFVDKLAEFFSINYPELKGFTRRGLYRMKQFYETYKDEGKVSPLVTQLNWSNHLLILSSCKTMEERIFYMKLSVKERYSKRELERQIESGYYERYMLSQNSIAPALSGNHTLSNIFLDNYVLDFLDVRKKCLKKIYGNLLIEI